MSIGGGTGLRPFRPGRQIPTVRERGKGKIEDSDVKARWPWRLRPQKAEPFSLLKMPEVHDGVDQTGNA